MAKTLSSPRKTTRKKVPPAPAAIASASPVPKTSFLNAGIFFSLFCFIGALLNFATQAVFRRDLYPGEFGTLNATFGLVGLLGLPLAALNQTITHHLAQQDARGEDGLIARLRSAARSLLEVSATASAVLAFVLLFFLIWVFKIPRFPLHLYALILVWVTLGGTLSSAFCLGLSRFRFWGILVLVTALFRFIFALLFTPLLPWAETALAISSLAGLVSLIPLLFASAELQVPRLEALRVFLNRGFLFYFLAAFSVGIGLYLFAFSDQLVAQKWFGLQPDNNMPEALIGAGEYDSYQAAGLLGRALLWGTQPLLLVYFTQISREQHHRRQGYRVGSLLTWARTNRLLLLYLATLLGGAIFLSLLRVPLARLFTGHEDPETARFISRFALAMVPIGLLQAVGTAFLAARRFVECYMLGGVGLVYFTILYMVGRQPDLLLSYMFGGAVICFFYLMFYVVIKWSRTQR